MHFYYCIPTFSIKTIFIQSKVYHWDVLHWYCIDKLSAHVFHAPWEDLSVPLTLLSGEATWSVPFFTKFFRRGFGVWNENRDKSTPSASSGCSSKYLSIKTPYVILSIGLVSTDLTTQRSTNIELFQVMELKVFHNLAVLY